MQTLTGIKNAMSAITHGVYVLGVHTPEKDNLMTAAWSCQVSSNPPTLVVAVSSKHLTAQLIPQAGGFAVSVLSDEQKETALRNGRVSGRERDKLADRADLVLDRVFITHSGISQNYIDLVRSTIQQIADFREICVTRASCTISCHCGPNTLGVLFLTK